MELTRLIILLLFIFLAIIIGRLFVLGYGRGTEQIFGGKDIIKNLDEEPASKFENEIRRIIEQITGKKFPCVYADWLKFRGKTLELDGYNKELGLAFEAQGPQHTIWDRKYDDSYDRYYNRLLNDAAKRKICQEKGIGLIIIDYKVPRYMINAYIKSRIWDLCVKGALDEKVCGKYAPVRPGNYVEKITHEPYRNKVLEDKANLSGLDEILAGIRD